MMQQWTAGLLQITHLIDNARACDPMDRGGRSASPGPISISSSSRRRVSHAAQIVTRTRCSSIPSADTLRNPAGSTRVTWRAVSAPPIDPHRGTLLDLRGVRRQEIGDDLQVERIADLE
jgi:hypothetical protein